MLREKKMTDAKLLIQYITDGLLLTTPSSKQSAAKRGFKLIIMPYHFLQETDINLDDLYLTVALEFSCLRTHLTDWSCTVNRLLVNPFICFFTTSSSYPTSKFIGLE